MQTHLIVLLIVCVVITSATPTTLWPQPTTYMSTESSNVVATISSTIFHSVTTVNKKSINNFSILKDALQRYSSHVFSQTITIEQATPWAAFIPHIKSLKQIELNTLSIQLDTTDVNVPIDLDESYRIDVPVSGNTIKIHANNHWGALRALETLTQLILPVVDSDKQSLLNHAIVYLPVTISDYPRYKWRALMVDLARHFLPIWQIQRIIDAMSWEKLNKLHLHLVDAQSFTTEIPKYENISRLSAFSPGMYYTQSQMKGIVEYAYQRGIDVIPEYDMPGHAYSWSHAFPEAVSTCPAGTVNINRFPVQPASEKTYEIIDAITKYSTETFRVPYFHIGSDEVVLACWEQDVTVQQFMNSTVAKDQGIKTMVDLYGYFQKRVQEIALKYNRTMMAWEELAIDVDTPVYKFPTTNTIVQAWHTETLNQVATAGYQVIHGGGFYLDKQKPSTSDVNRHLWMDTWKDFYESDPNKFVTDPVARARVLGVEGEMWGEQNNIVNIESRIWPRMSAVSERGWSSENMTCDEPILCLRQEPRLINHICQTLVKRGLKTGPIRPDYCPYLSMFDDSIASHQHQLTKYALIASVAGNVVLLVALIAVGTIVTTKYTKRKAVSDDSETASLTVMRY
jgi:hexosaminidase